MKNYDEKWFKQRIYAENNKIFFNVFGKRKSSSLILFFGKILCYFIGLFQKMGLFIYPKKINVLKKKILFNNLPPKFNNFKILHISDTHFDLVPNLEENLRKTIKNMRFDACFFTGDLLENSNADLDSGVDKLIFSLSSCYIKYGIFAVLGNHDSANLYKKYLKRKIKILVNSSTTIKKLDESILITGIDDTSFFFREENINCLKEKKIKNLENGNKFKIILSHTPELIDIFDQNLYKSNMFV